MSIYLATEFEVVTCGATGCSQIFAMHRRFYNKTQETGQTWYCPDGHPRVWKGHTTRQKLEAEQARARHLEDQLRASIAEGETTRQALLRDRQRFANGVCPCCNRSFTNVARHMATQHPDYDAARIVTEPGLRRHEFTCSCGRTFGTLTGLRIHQGRMRSEGWNKPNTSAWRSHLTVV